MPNKPPKQPRIGPEHSREREFTAVLEDLRSQFRTFGDGLTDIQEKVSHIPGIIQRLDQIDEKLCMMELGFSSLRRDLSIVKSKDFEKFATKQDFEKFAEDFNKRLMALEAR